ncbi:MAG TPA: uroporphyrinogen decarboxylase, partial [Desulfurobacteriaceae bacterium]|nr:uroporphyrinogen decarboxylase [Desulfurobacteriaceae bacterium]
MEKLRDHPILLMAKGEAQKALYTPVWFMRQAGRYQKSYREIRSKVSSFWDLVKNPDLAAKVTLLPIYEFDFDAAILFSDILTILEPFGFKIEFKNGIKINPGLYDLTSQEIQQLLKTYDVATKVDYVYETIRKILSKLEDRPLIGFSGAPFTLALYLIEGGSSKKYEKVRIFMHTRKKDFHYIMDILSKTVESYLENQIKAGVHLVQIFDSWAGILSEKEYENYVFPYTDR